MNRFVRAVSPVSISLLGVGLVGLTVTACSPSSSAGSAPAATTTQAPVATHSPAAAKTPAATRSSAAPAPASPAAPASAPAVAPASGGVVTYKLFDCTGKAEVKPSTYVLTCADYGMMLEGMHWVTWRPGYAASTGTMHEKDCKPNCAEGKIITYPVDATLTGSVEKSGTHTYTKITLYYPDSAPAVYVTVNGKVTETHPHTFSMNLVNGPAR